MELDVRQITEKLIADLWTQSEKLRAQAEGVKLLYQTLIQEGDKLNGQQAEEQASDILGQPETTQE